VEGVGPVCARGAVVAVVAVVDGVATESGCGSVAAVPEDPATV
jgi:hypothetical protein